MGPQRGTFTNAPAPPAPRAPPPPRCGVLRMSSSSTILCSNGGRAFQPVHFVQQNIEEADRQECLSDWSCARMSQQYDAKQQGTRYISKTTALLVPPISA